MKNIKVKDLRAGMRVGESASSSPLSHTVWGTVLTDAAMSTVEVGTPGKPETWRQWTAKFRTDDAREFEFLATEGYEHYGPTLWIEQTDLAP